MRRPPPTQPRPMLPAPTDSRDEYNINCRCTRELVLLSIQPEKSPGPVPRRGSAHTRKCRNRLSHAERLLVPGQAPGLGLELAAVPSLPSASRPPAALMAQIVCD
jgi:hypothetical protein